jgi:hypothetical protein
MDPGVCAVPGGLLSFVNISADVIPSVAGQQLAILLRIPEVPGSNLRAITGYPD